MTTFQVREDQALADALGDVATWLEQRHDYVARTVHELRAAAGPGNGWPGPASVPWADRGRISEALRAVASDGPHPLAAQLEDLAAGLDASVAQYRVNGGRC